MNRMFQDGMHLRALAKSALDVAESMRRDPRAYEKWRQEAKHRFRSAWRYFTEAAKDAYNDNPILEAEAIERAKECKKKFQEIW